MKMLKNVKAVVAVVMILTIALAMTACGGSKLDGTYTHNVYLSESGNLYAWSALFLPAVNQQEDYTSDTTPIEVNTLVLDGGNYTLTKAINLYSEAHGFTAIDLKYTFTGTYTEDGTTVTLAIPTQCDYKVIWSEAAITNSGGMIANSEGTSTEISDECFTFFNGDYVANAAEVTEQVVELNAEDGSYTCVNAEG